MKKKEKNMTPQEILKESIARHGYEWTAWTCQVTSMTVRNWERCETVPRFHEMVRLCRVLGIPLDSVEV